ncbi:KAP family NTPase [Myxococcota bacterium]|nr:KAP family NTPase [Myxococcota bacterium]
MHTIYDSRPLEADELWPEQVTILNSIYHHVENMIDDAGSRNWREGDNGNGAWASPEPKRTHRTLFLNGTRGIGKTSILLTALRSWNWHRISLQNSNKHNLNEDNKNNILSKFHEQGRSVLALPLLDFDQLSPKISSISWIILSFKNLVERATTMRSDLDKDRSNLLNRWQNFFKSTLTVWSPEPLSKSSSVDDYILDLQDACNGLFGIYGTWYDLIDNLIEKLHKNGDLSKNGVILVSIDDLDLNPGFILELLLAQRILWHPKLIFILSGDEERLKKSLEKELSKREESESSLLINLSTDIYDKFISRYYRISLPMATTLNAFSFSIGINYHRINHQGYLLERINSYLPNNENNEIKSFFVNLIMKNNDFERFKWRSIQFLKNEYSYEKIIISLMGIIFNDLIPNSDGEDLVNKLFQKNWFILPENNNDWIELVTIGSSEFNRFYKTDHKSSYDFFVEIDGNLFRSNLPIILDTFYHLIDTNNHNHSRITTTFPPIISILNKDYNISFILPTKRMNVSNILIYKERCEEILSKRPLSSGNYDYFFVKSWINEIIFDNAPLDDENITISNLINKTRLRLTLDSEIFLLIGLLSSPEYSFSEDISNEILEALLRQAINKKVWLNFCARLDEFRLTNIKNTLFCRNRIGNNSNQIDQNKYIEYINENFRSSPWFSKERISFNWLIDHNHAFLLLLKKTFFTKEYYHSASRVNPINLNLDLIDLFYFKSSRDFSIENQTWIGKIIDDESRAQPRKVGRVPDMPLRS